MEWSFAYQLPGRQKDDTLDASIGQDLQCKRPCLLFSQRVFLSQIINFVVANDQVHRNQCHIFCSYFVTAQSINIVKCPEFHSLLLLLQEDLQEKDIPHCTKLCEAIIMAWEVWFKTLKGDLAIHSIIYYAHQ